MAKVHIKQLIRSFIRRHKRAWLISTATVVVGGVGIAAIVIKTTAKPVANAQTTTSVQKVAPKPKPLTSTLSGLPITDAAVNQKTVTGVMIENSVQARPQAGLGQASVVFEAIAEGGITRFLALFQDTAPDNIGPVRSARPYYEQWALGFDASYAHVGGSPEALANIKAWGVRDLDQFYNSGAYHRISSRVAPHNVYTSVAALSEVASAKGYTSSTYTGFPRQAEAPAKQPTAKSINMSISGPTYNVHYDYDASKNSYNRSEGGAPHVDSNTNAQISPKVVIGLVMPYGIQKDGYHSEYNTIGSGAAYIFQNGTATVGTWTKTANNAQFVFKDQTGKTIALNPGQTWVTALGAANQVGYTP